jgi:hypothetical protein
MERTTNTGQNQGYYISTQVGIKLQRFYGRVLYSDFFSHICDVQILANFASKIAKLVEITLENHIYPNFSRFFVRKKRKFGEKKKTGVLYWIQLSGNRLQISKYYDSPKIPIMRKPMKKTKHKPSL